MSLTSHVSTSPDRRSEELTLHVSLNVLQEFEARLQAVIDSDDEFTLESVIIDALEQYLDSLECPDEDADALAALKPRVMLPFCGKVSATAPAKTKGYPTFDEIVEHIRRMEGGAS